MPSLRIQLSALAAAVLGAAAVQAAPSHGGVAAVSSASQTGSGEGDVKIGIMDTISTAVDTASLREGLVRSRIRSRRTSASHGATSSRLMRPRRCFIRNPTS